MGHRIEVMSKHGIENALKGLISKTPIVVYQIKDDFSEEELKKISEFVADPIADSASVDKPIANSVVDDIIGNWSVIEKSPKPGVTDAEGEETRKALSRMLGKDIGPVSTSRQHIWKGKLDEEQYLLLKKRIGNPLIHSYVKVDSENWRKDVGVGFHFPDLNLPAPEPFKYIDLDVSDTELLKISQDRYIGLNLAEMKELQKLYKNEHFIEMRKEAGLEAIATDAEIEGFGVSWSDHNVHKKFKGIWTYTSEDDNDESGLPETIDNAFKSIIASSTYRILKKTNYIKAVFEENSGVIDFNERYIISFKVETHNHPSDKEGFGGANTGTGGVIRDPAHTGIWMDVVSNQFSFRTAHPNSYSDLPLNMQTPARCLETIIEGVEDYGNKMGIPTQCGTVMIDYTWFKPAVFVGAVAVAKKQINGRATHVKDIQPGYVAISLGGRVGKDGIHGAPGSSMVAKAEDADNKLVNQSVQIGNPLTQRKYFEVGHILAEKGLIEASQDCGAGGWHSAVGELAELCNSLEKGRYKIQHILLRNGIDRTCSLRDKMDALRSIDELNKEGSPIGDLLFNEIYTGRIFDRKSYGQGGVIMDLSDVKEKYKGLNGWEKLVSEAQERGVLVSKPENVPRILEICEHNDVEASILGTFNDSGFYHVKDQGKTIAFLPMEILHEGVPRMSIKAHWKRPVFNEPEILDRWDLTNNLLNMMGQPNMQNYNWIFERYDHEVKGGSLIKPIVGLGRGKSDAIAYHPILSEEEVVIESWGSNPWQGEIDSYHMGRNNVVDAIGRVIAAGGNLEKIVFNGNTTCPPPEKNELDAAKVLRMLKGAADAEEFFETPTISGKDSNSMQKSYKSVLNGETKDVKGMPELLKSALCVIKNKDTLTTNDFKLPGDRIYIIGETREELGASEYFLMRGEIGNKVPKSNFDKIRIRYDSMINAMKEGLVHSAQYIGKGGISAAIATSSMNGNLGADVKLDALGKELKSTSLLFSETTGRFIVSVHPSNAEKFENIMKDCYCRSIGEVCSYSLFQFRYKGNKVILTDIVKLRTHNKGDIEF